MNNEDIHNYFITFFPDKVKNKIKSITNEYQKIRDIDKINSSQIKKFSYTYENKDLFIMTEFEKTLKIQIEIHNSASDGIGIHITSQKDIFSFKTEYLSLIGKLYDGQVISNGFMNMLHGLDFIDSESLFFIFDNVGKSLNKKEMKELLMLTYDREVNDVYFDLIYETIQNPNHKKQLKISRKKK